MYRCPIARHERHPFWGRAPVTALSEHGRYPLKTLFVGLCLLFVATQTAAAAKGDATASSGTTVEAASGRQAAKPEKRAASLEIRLEHKLGAATKYRSVIRFFSNHRRLLRSPEHGAKARTILRKATRSLQRTTRTIESIRLALERREARLLAKAPPRKAICAVFGRRYCRQAISVAWCESRHSTSAQNGQYLGLFQMGWSERRLFGHGPTAHKQAVAAHRYFVVSGRDWSPWSCKPWYGY